MQNSLWTKGLVLGIIVLFVGASVLQNINTSVKANPLEIRYGFWPSWTSSLSYQPNWYCLTHVSYAFLRLNQDGTIHSIENEVNFQNVKNIAHSNAVKMTITVTTYNSLTDNLHDTDYYEKILADYKQDAANSILQVIQAYDLDGVCLDFEGIIDDDNEYTDDYTNTELMEDFLSILHTTLTNYDSNCHIAYCVQGSTESIYRNINLAQYIDAVIIMGYDFHIQRYDNDPTHTWAHNTGPNSPYNDPYNFDVKDSVELLDNYYPINKIILAVPFYGWDWECTSSDPYCERLPTAGNSVTMVNAITNANTYGRLWDSNSNTPWYKYQISEIWHQCWYEDEISIEIKHSYVENLNLGGIGFWALGYEGNSAEIWNVIGECHSRSGGPDSFGYKYLDSNTPQGPTYDWIEISSNGNQILPSSDDSWVENINLGFFFNYYGTDYSQLAIGNNGLLFSGSGTSQYVNQPITQTPSIHGLIAPYWDDIVTWESADAIYYKTIGTAPNRMFVVEWNNNQHYYSSTSGITFEVILYEGTNNILFQYQDVDFGTVTGAVGGDNPPYDNGGSATVGIEDPTGNIGLQYSFNEEVVVPGLAILFKFPAFTGTNMHLSMIAPPSMDHGNTMTYTLFFNNFGDVAAPDVILQATLSSNVDFISTSDGGTYDSTTRIVTWNIGTVPAFPSGRGSRTIIVIIPNSVPVGTVIPITASISTTTLETRYDDNSASTQTIVTGSNLPSDVEVNPIIGNTGGTPIIYWHTPITFSYYSECATSVEIIIHINDGGPDVTGTMTETAPNTWTYTISFLRYGSATITYNIEGCSVTSVSFTIYIDPAGYIYNINTGNRISGANIWLQCPDGTGEWQNVPTGQIPPIMQPDINPQITDSNGQYQWDVLPGTYRVHVEASGYYPENSSVVNIPPPINDLHVGLIPIISASYDVNHDGIVNFQDAGLVWVHRTTLVPYDSLYDVNNDGQVNFQDAGLTWVNRD